MGLNHALEFHAEVAFLCQSMTKQLRNGTIYTAFQCAVLAIGLLRAFLMGSAPCPVWLTFNALLAVVGYVTWVSRCAYANARYQQFNERLAQKRYAAAEVAEDGLDASAKWRCWSTAVRLESIQSLDKHVAHIFGIPVKPHQLGFVGAKAFVGVFFVSQLVLNGTIDLGSSFSMAFLTVG